MPKLTNPIYAPDEALPVHQAIRVLQDFFTIDPPWTPEHRRGAVLTAIFVLRLLEKGDLHYEPMPE